jgi:single-stranded-DNA-specific exonuclease
MKDMDKAVSRIENAIANGENILVFGDYDVDGTTAVSLVSSYLRSYYQNIATYIPDRYDEGYGISYKGIDFADDNNFSLIIALDCGIKSIDHIDYAKAKNIDFIICDHHRPGDKLPNAVAVLDPKRR